MTVLAAHAWPTNAELIADVAKLYIGPDDVVMDPTYGRGNWWKTFTPARLITHDIRQDGVDFRALPEADDTIDVVAFDPPYIAPGGRKTSTIGEFNDRFGLHETPATPIELADYIAAGVKECARVLRPRGRLLVKCKDYINGGAFFPGTHLVITAALDAGLRYEDRFEHIGRPGPQPPRDRQVHSRRNLSTLLVFQRVPAARRRRVQSASRDELFTDADLDVALAPMFAYHHDQEQ